MMKRLFSVFVVLLLVISLSVTAFAAEDTMRMYDLAGLMSEKEVADLETKLDSVSEQFKVNITIVAFDTVDGEDLDELVEELFDEAELGYGESQDGVLLLLAVEEREFRILSNGSLGAAAISADDIEDITDTITPALSDGDYVKAFGEFVDACEYQINGEINGFPFDFAKNLLIALGIGLVIAFIVTGVMKGKLKSVRKQNAATQYTKKGSMQVTASNDFYLYRIVDRQKKESSSSSSSGSSRNVGGGKF